MPYISYSLVYLLLLSKKLRIKIYKPIFSHVALYWGESHLETVFGNGVLRITVGPKREEVSGIRRKLQNQLHNLYYFSNNIRNVIEMK
jgi:hypothetical protein